jgi:hypothetical protein
MGNGVHEYLRRTICTIEFAIETILNGKLIIFIIWALALAGTRPVGL